MRHLDNFLGRLQGVRRQGRGWRACCPLHDDEEPSLSISLGEGNRILFNCPVCGRQASPRILQAIGLAWRDCFAQGRDRFVRPDLQASRGTPAVTEEDADLRNRVYSYLVSHGQLTKEHQDNLANRGLSPVHIHGDGYCSLQCVTRATLQRLYQDYGPALYKVPGFCEDVAGSPTLWPKGGLFIPVRNDRRQIIAGQVRTGGNPKYLWMKGSGAPYHVPLMVDPGETVWITEGPLKADVVAGIGGLPVIGVAGVGTWHSVLPALRRWATRHVVIAYDADCAEKQAVHQQRASLSHALHEAGYRVTFAEWDMTKGKGLDDLLLAGGRPQMREVWDGRKKVEGQGQPA